MKKNHNIIRFVQSLIILPMLSTGPAMSSLPQGGLGMISGATQTVMSAKHNIELDLDVALKSTTESNKSDADSAELLKIKGAKIDAYYKEKGMPLYGTGEKMAFEAEKNGLDWRLIAAISIRESTGGKFKCVKVPNNPFGWGSCKIGFESYDKAIETVARNLGGNNPKTAHHYDGKDTISILESYNPRSVVATYPEQVVKIMDTISTAEITSEVAVNI